MRRLILLLLAAGCTREAADSLVVVTVDSTAQLNGISLHATATTSGQTRDIDIAGPLSIPPTTNFAVQLNASYSGAFSVHVEARDMAGTTLASGDAMTTLAQGKRVDVTVLLDAPMPDMAGPPPDMAGPPLDMAGPPPDMTQPPDLQPIARILSQPVWIASGGSASSATQRLNLTVGGSATVETTAAPSGATFTGGFAAQQSY